jgi:hypothetical protein
MSDSRFQQKVGCGIILLALESCTLAVDKESTIRYRSYSLSERITSHLDFGAYGTVCTYRYGTVCTYGTILYE